MKRSVYFLAAVAAAAAFAVAPTASAHNRAYIVLPNDNCVYVGAGNIVYLGPDKTTWLDLYPADAGHPEFGTSYAALNLNGSTPLQKGLCPS